MSCLCKTLEYFTLINSTECTEKASAQKIILSNCASKHVFRNIKFLQLGIEWKLIRNTCSHSLNNLLLSSFTRCLDKLYICTRYEIGLAPCCYQSSVTSIPSQHNQNGLTRWLGSPGFSLAFPRLLHTPHTLAAAAIYRGQQDYPKGCIRGDPEI